jgi:hypothetical protein
VLSAVVLSAVVLPVVALSVVVSASVVQVFVCCYRAHVRTFGSERIHVLHAGSTFALLVSFVLLFLFLFVLLFLFLFVLLFQLETPGICPFCLLYLGGVSRHGQMAPKWLVGSVGLA